MAKMARHSVSLLSNDQKTFVSAKFEQCCLTALGCKGNRINVGFSMKDKELSVYPSDEGTVLEHPASCPCRFLTTTDISNISEQSRQSAVRVGVSFVIQSTDGHVLLTRRPKTMRSFPNIWVTPGGHLENGETLQQAGIREVQEETGVYVSESNISTLGLWESVYPPVLSMGLPTSHHVVVYMLAKLPQMHRDVELTLQESEVSAATWLDEHIVSEIVKSDEYGKTRMVPQRYFSAKVTENGQQVDKSLPLSSLMACMPQAEDWNRERLSSGSKFALGQWLRCLRAPPLAQAGLAFDSAGVNWEEQGQNCKLVDFTMPGKGYIVKTGGQFCALLDITPSQPRGNAWLCQPMAETVDELSCGVTGCFALVGGILHVREGIDDDSPLGSGWLAVDNPKHEILVKIAAGPMYELWAITADGFPYKRLGMKDDIPSGTSWELVPEVFLKDVSLGIYGPVGIAKDSNLIIILNGTPTPKRQREMDDRCLSLTPECVYPGNGVCTNGGTVCQARYTINQHETVNKWRCLGDSAVGKDGQVLHEGNLCLYTRHTHLLPIAMRSPVLGDFEKQLWLDSACQNPEFNTNASGCSDAYFAAFDTTSSELVCRPAVPTDSCPIVDGLHDNLFDLTTVYEHGNICIARPNCQAGFATG